MQKGKTIVVGDMVEVPEMVGSVTFVRMINKDVIFNLAV
jgi:hypothetical protein